MAANWEAEGLKIAIKGLRLPSGLVLDEVLLDSSGTRVSTEPFAVTLASDARASVRVSFESIEAYLEGLGIGGLSGFAVSGEDGHLRVQAVARVIVSIPASVLCSLSSPDEKSVVLAVVEAEPAAARSLVERQLAAVNPVFDISGLATNLSIEGVEAGASGVEVRARAD